MISKLKIVKNYLLKRPTRVYIDLTHKCNYNCVFCNSINNKTKEISLNEWEKIILKIKKELGNCFLYFSGGEPLLYKDFFSLLKFTKENGFYVGMVTNGFFINKVNAYKLINSGIDSITISLESLKEKIQLDLTKKRNTIAKVKEAINNLKKEIKNQKKPFININTVITKKNYSELIKIIEFVENQKLNGISFLGLSFNPTDSKVKELMLDKNEQKEFSIIVDKLIELKKKGAKINNTIKELKIFKKYYSSPNIIKKGYPCDLRNRLYIFPDGTTYSCSKLNPLGNIQYSSLRTILKKQDNIIKQSIYCEENCIFPCTREQPFLKKIKSLL